MWKVCDNLKLSNTRCGYLSAGAWGILTYKMSNTWIMGIFITKRYVEPHPYYYCWHEFHSSKLHFMLSFTFYFVGGLAHIFPTYFLVFKSENIHKSLPINSIGLSKHALWFIILVIHVSYNAIYCYACFVECKRYHFILHISYCHSLLTEPCKTLHGYIEEMQ